MMEYTKEQLIDISDGILNMIDSYCNLDGLGGDEYNQVKLFIADHITTGLGLGIKFTDEELGI